MSVLFDLTLHLRLIGVLLLFLAASHALFPKRFAWKEELERLSLLNRQVFWVHTYFVVLIVAMFGLLSLLMPGELLSGTPLARAVLLGMTVFWGFRLYCQWFVYRAELWRGHRFNTAVHIAFTFLWAYLTTVNAAALFSAGGSR
jgi:hypothetical protein